MLDATRGKGRFPLIRTFCPGLETSTNSVYQDMDQAERWSVLEELMKHNAVNLFVYIKSFSLSLSLFRDGIGSRAGGVDISDLTWEQKEQRLRNCSLQR